MRGTLLLLPMYCTVMPKLNVYLFALSGNENKEQSPEIAGNVNN